MAQKSSKSDQILFCNYLFRVQQAYLSYSFSNGYRNQPTAYSEHSHPVAIATCEHPPRFAGRETHFTFIGDREVDRDLRAQKENAPAKNGVGELIMRGERSEYLGTLPFDVALMLPQLATAGCLRYILCNGQAMKHGHARINSIGLYDQFDLTDIQ